MVKGLHKVRIWFLRRILRIIQTVLTVSREAISQVGTEEKLNETVRKAKIKTQVTFRERKMLQQREKLKKKRWKKTEIQFRSISQPMDDGDN